MADQENDQQALHRLRPFFHKYVGAFVKVLLKNLKEAGVVGESDANKFSYAAGYLFFRHLFPGMEMKRLPKISGEVEALYKRLLGERVALSEAVLKMRQDLTAFQQREQARQMEAFRTFLELSLKDVAKLSGQAVVELAPANPEEQAALEEEQAKSEQEERETLFDLLHKIRDKKSELLCFNLFQDVPISYEANLLQVTPARNQVTLRVHRYQATVIAQDRFTYLKHDQLPGSIKANLVSLNREKREAIFRNLEFSTVGMDERSHVRVRPRAEDPLLATATLLSGENIKGNVLDISMGGMGMLTSEIEIDIGAPVDVSITPRNLATLNLHGTVLAVKPKGKGQIILGLKLRPDTNAEVFISQYVYQRQAEVVRELQKKSLE